MLESAHLLSYLFVFFNDTATTEIYTLSLHDALPIFSQTPWYALPVHQCRFRVRTIWRCSFQEPLRRPTNPIRSDRKSTRLNSSHANISYAVFCLKKNKTASQ